MSPAFKLPTAETFKVQLRAMFNTRGDFSGITWQNMEMAIGANADKYRPLWERLSSSDKKGVFAALSPCWTGMFLLGVSWAVARRMYPFAIMLFIIMLVFNIVFPSESDTTRLLGVAIFISFTYKSAYLKWLAHCIRQINAQGLTVPEREVALRQIGGLDQKSGWIAAGAVIIMGIVLDFVCW